MIFITEHQKSVKRQERREGRSKTNLRRRWEGIGLKWQLKGRDILELLAVMAVIAVAYFALPDRYHLNPDWQEAALIVMLTSVGLAFIVRSWRNIVFWISLRVSSAIHLIVVHAWTRQTPDLGHDRARIAFFLFTLEQMIELLNNGLTVATLLELIAWRLHGAPLSREFSHHSHWQKLYGSSGCARAQCSAAHKLPRMRGYNWSTTFSRRGANKMKSRACCWILLFHCFFAAHMWVQTLQVVNLEGHSTTFTADQIAKLPHVTVETQDHDKPVQFEGDISNGRT